MEDKEYYQLVEDTVVKLLGLAATSLPKYVKNALYRAHELEPSNAQLLAIKTNFELAEKNFLPMCQDTGVPIFYVKIGYDAPPELIKILPKAIESGTRRATKEIPLRPNAVDPIRGGNTGDNTGKGFPIINYEFVEGDTVEIFTLPKGGGSENMSRLGMLKPGEGIKGIKKFVIETVFHAGGNPCPPIIVGVGIGGGADVALKLGKKALLRPIGQRHPEPDIAALELELLEKINQLGIGAMGLGGKTTALDVKIEYVMRHPASLPVGVVIQCWADRRAHARISSDGTVEILSHEEHA